MPADPFQRARVLQWMFFEQYSHETAIAVARFIRMFLKKHDDPRLPALGKRGYTALGVMDRHLSDRAFFVGDALSIADLALFAYTTKPTKAALISRHIPPCVPGSGESRQHPASR